MNCSASASCDAKASAHVSCPPPQVTIAITGDDALLAAYTQFQGDLGDAVNQTVAITTPIKTVAGDTISTFQALGDVGAGGVSCVASQATVAAHAQASISVSVSASASVSGSSS